MASHPKTRLSFEEYLAIEHRAEQRSEYFNGEVFAMAGASRAHNRIVTNLTSALDNQLSDHPCNVYSSDMRVRVSATGLATYPDVVVTCGDELFYDKQQDTLLNPIVLIEVLSDSTEKYDRGRKFEHYQRIESLREYVLIAQDRQRIEHYVRQDGNHWIYSEIHASDDVLKLTSIGCQLSVTNIYSKLNFEPPDSAN